MPLSEIVALLEAHLKELKAATDIGVYEEYTGRTFRYPDEEALVSRWEDAIDTLNAIIAAVEG